MVPWKGHINVTFYVVAEAWRLPMKKNIVLFWRDCVINCTTHFVFFQAAVVHDRTYEKKISLRKIQCHAQRCIARMFSLLVDNYRTSLQFSVWNSILQYLFGLRLSDVLTQGGQERTLSERCRGIKALRTTFEQD